MREQNSKNCHRKGLMEDELCGCGVKLNDLQNRWYFILLSVWTALVSSATIWWRCWHVYFERILFMGRADKKVLWSPEKLCLRESSCDSTRDSVVENVTRLGSSSFSWVTVKFVLHVSSWLFHYYVRNVRLMPLLLLLWILILQSYIAQNVTGIMNFKRETGSVTVARRDHLNIDST